MLIALGKYLDAVTFRAIVPPLPLVAVTIFVDVDSVALPIVDDHDDDHGSPF